MKKILLLAALALCTASLSASTLTRQKVTEYVPEPTVNCLTYSDLAINVIDYSGATEVTQELAFQSEVPVTGATPLYVTSANLIDLTLFFRPVIYEWRDVNLIIYNSNRCRFKNTIALTRNKHQKQDLVFYKKLPGKFHENDPNPTQGNCS